MTGKIALLSFAALTLLLAGPAARVPWLGGVASGQNAPKAESDAQTEAEKKQAIEAFRQQVKQQMDMFKGQCLGAFHHDGYCGCLSTTVPLAVSFETYIFVTINDRAALLRMGQGENWEKVIDASNAAGKNCAEKSF